ncbi:MAG: hypothetical protein J5848_04045 [Bacteroidales bacterium]|nr:hypothetical protein [Bacteroidales bacterium]
MSKRKKHKSFNIPVVLSVAALAAVVLVVFFSSRQEEPVMLQVDTLDIIEDSFDEIEYYNQEADNYVNTLPDDKCVVARLVDSLHHQVFYYEKNNAPSFYVYDLEKRSTSVLFSGTEGFYKDTVVYVIGAVKECRLIDNKFVFITVNNSVSAEAPNAVIVFSMDIDNFAAHFIDFGSDARFNDERVLAVDKARLVYHSVMSDNNLYTTYTVTTTL